MSVIRSLFDCYSIFVHLFSYRSPLTGPFDMNILIIRIHRIFCLSAGGVVRQRVHVDKVSRLFERHKAEMRMKEMQEEITMGKKVKKKEKPGI